MILLCKGRVIAPAFMLPAFQGLAMVLETNLGQKPNLNEIEGC